MQVRKAKEATSKINHKLQGAEESYWAVFPVNSPNNFSASICRRFNSLYVIVLRLGKTFEDHVM